MADVRDVNLNRLAVFIAVVDAGSITAAAARLGLTKTMVSTHLQRLEREVDASLVVRTTRQLNVTEAGRAFYDASVKIVQAAEDAIDAAGGAAAPIRGTLRVAAPVDYGALVVAPALVALRALHPALQVELICHDHNVDLIAEAIDVAVRLGNLADSNYRAVKLGEFSKFLLASPDCLARWGVPESLDALSQWPMVAMSALPNPLTLRLQHTDGETRQMRFENALACNTANGALSATLAGGGFALLTDFSAAADLSAGRLIRILPQWSSGRSGIHAIYPPTHHPSAKVRAFIDLLRNRLMRLDAPDPRESLDAS